RRSSARCSTKPASCVPVGSRCSPASASPSGRSRLSSPEVSVAAEHNVGVLGRTLPLDVSVFGFHPLLPLRSRVSAVALETALESYVARRLDPDRVGEIRPESLT